jgi:amphi-Trp domain-containing protein
MKIRDRERIDCAELAGRLRRFADMVESGNVQVRSERVPVGGEVEYEVALEEDRGRGKLEIEAKWRQATPE